MEAEPPVGDGWSRGGHVQRLELMNAAAEKVHFYRQLLLHVDDQLNRARLALGAYRRGDVGPAMRWSSRRSGSSILLQSSSNKTSNIGRTVGEEEERENEEKAAVQCHGGHAGEDAASSREFFLLGTTFVRADSAVLCTFLKKRIQQLEARRDTYRRGRKAAVAALLQLSPSVTDLAEAEWRLLLEEPEVQRWKEQADMQEAARQQLVGSLRREDIS